MDGRRVRAVYNPTRTDDLNPRAKATIGQEFIWDQMWVIEPEDDGPYVGQDAWTIVGRKEFLDDYPMGFGWVPTEDLRVVEVIQPAWRTA